MANQNKTLGRFQLTDIPPAPRGVPQIEVSFDIDANGIVNVKAKDLGTGKEQSITIQNDTGLSEADIDRMVREAEENAEADAKLKEAADVRNNADQLVFQAEKALSDLGDSVTAEEKSDTESKIADLKEALKGDNLEDIKAKTEKLNEVAQALATKAYQQAQQSQEQTDDPSSNGQSDDGVVDAEFEEVD